MVLWHGLVWFLLITQAMAGVRWWSADHFSFWHGLKELVWATVPIINFFYVWDLWLDALGWAVRAVTLLVMLVRWGLGV